MLLVKLLYLVVFRLHTSTSGQRHTTDNRTVTGAAADDYSANRLLFAVSENGEKCPSFQEIKVKSSAFLFCPTSSVAEKTKMYREIQIQAFFAKVIKLHQNSRRLFSWHLITTKMLRIRDFMLFFFSSKKNKLKKILIFSRSSIFITIIFCVSLFYVIIHCRLDQRSNLSCDGFFFSNNEHE